MRKTEQKRHSRDAILASAGALVRERGIRASSVADVMKGAGLTVGGFYGHFASKEALFGETIHGAARALWDELLAATPDAPPRERALAVLGRYLSRTHRDHPETGCLLPSVVADVDREGEPYRTALAAELNALAAPLAALLGPHDGARAEALGLIALMYGALSLSRAVRGTALSDELLRAGKALGAAALPDVPRGPAAPREVDP